MTQYTLEDYLAMIPSVLTFFSCLWLFFKYFSQFRINKKNTGFTLIIILVFSDFVFSSNILIFLIKESFIDSYMALSIGIYFFALYFSVLWASAIAYLVYKSLQKLNEESKQPLVEHETNQPFAKTLITVLIITAILAP